MLTCRLLDHLDNVLLPALSSGCEKLGLWKYKNCRNYSSKFLKHILNLKSCTKSFIVYGENKRFPFSFNIYFRMVSYLAKLFSDSENKSVHIFYKHLLALYNYEFFKNPLIDGMHSIFDNCRFSKIWIEEFVNVQLINYTSSQDSKTSLCRNDLFTLEILPKIVYIKV